MPEKPFLSYEDARKVQLDQPLRFIPTHPRLGRKYSKLVTGIVIKIDRNFYEKIQFTLYNSKGEYICEHSECALI